MRTFALEDAIYEYADAAGERTVELAVVARLVKATEAAGGRILEVGNVLAHHQGLGPWKHEVVDKYEIATGVRNEDAEHCGGGPYDLIVSISTLEHVGWDEPPRDPEKARRAIEHLATLGPLVATVPLGYNPHMDLLVLESAGQVTLKTPWRRNVFDRVVAMKRTTLDNQWVSTDELVGARYNEPWPWGNVVAFGYRDKSTVHA